jgi:glycosyltransferase involved in cell wall biosynthesis
VKICLVSSLFPPQTIGGAEVMVSQAADGLHAAGHSVSVVTTAPRAETGDEVVRGIRIRRILTGNLYWPGAAPTAPMALKPVWHAIDLWNPVVYRRLRRILRDDRPDVVHTNNLGGLSPAVWAAARAEGMPIVHTPHDYALTCVRAMRLTRGGLICESRCSTCAIRGAWLRRVSGAVAAVAAPSRFVLDRHLELGFFPGAKAHVVPWAVDKPPAVSTVRTHGPLGVLLIGQLRAHKGIRVALAAIAAAPDLDIRLDIAGTGELLAECRAAAARDPRIRVHGFVTGSAKEALFRDSHVLVCPSTWWEVTGIVILEAYARGLPAIGSRIGGIPEVIDHGKTGFLVKPGDSVELAARLRELAANRDLVRTLAQRALAHADANRVDAMAARLSAVYADVTDAAGQRRDI